MEQSFNDHRKREALNQLETALCYNFRHIEFLETALTHSSYVHENPQLAAADNERYEFLGDAVLGFCVSDMLIKKYPDFSEGSLSQVRSSLVNEKPLARLAKKLNLGDYLLLGKGEDISGGRFKDSLLANALEAVLAAIYLDAGMTKAKSTMKKLIGPLLEDNSLRSQYFDYKTALQEFCQKKYKAAPIYALIDSHGPDHAKIFEVKVTIADKTEHLGSGRSKKEAEKNAAQKAWKELQNEE